MKSNIRIWQGATAVFAVLFLIMVFVVIKGGSKEPAKKAGNAERTAITRAQASGARSPALTLIEDNDPVLGDPDAEISIVEFSDFQCSYCARSFSTTQAEFRQSDYFNSGQVNWVYKHFPLQSIHPLAQKAAEAGECANRQGKFWDYHDTLFENQRRLDVASLKSYASTLGLDTDEFDRCLDENEAKGEVSKELSVARAAGGQGTPFFVVINNVNKRGVPLRGAVPFDQLAKAIDSLL